MNETPMAIRSVGLTRYYGELCAVDALDLDVRQGELLAFLGPNGAGKTTTIRMLTGLIRPSAGTAYVGGHDVVSDPLAVKETVGVVPQRSNLYAELSARDNLIFCAQLYGLPRGQWTRRVAELLSSFGLTEWADAPFGRLSGGVKRRVTIAAALMHEPSILFLDEPTTGLDVRSARQLRATVQALKGRGVTVFMTTHVIAEAERLADRVAIIVRGALAALGTPRELCAQCQEELVLRVGLSAIEEGLIDALRGNADIDGVSRAGDELHVVVRSVDRAVSLMQDLVHQQGGEILEIQTARPSLEDAFVHITRLDSEVMAMSAPQGGPRR